MKHHRVSAVAFLLSTIVALSVIAKPTGSFTPLSSNAGPPALSQQKATGALRADPPSPNSANAWGDFDDDGLDDLFLSSPKGSGVLMRNRGEGQFEDVSPPVLLAYSAHIRQAQWIDFDGDLRMDLFILSLDGSCCLLQNVGSGHFNDVSRAVGLTADWTAIYAQWRDYDGDRQPDLQLELADGGLGIYRNLGGTEFEAIGLRPFQADSGPELTSTRSINRASLSNPRYPQTSIDSESVPRSSAPVPSSEPSTVSVVVEASAPTMSGLGSGASPAVSAGCAGSVVDQNGGPCLRASSAPMLGLLHPISKDLYIDGATRNVGVKTVSPARSLEVEGTLRLSSRDALWTTKGWGKGIEVARGNVIQWLRGSGTISRGIGLGSDETFYVGRSLADDDSAPALYDLAIDSLGRVGIGTPTPLSALHVAGDFVLRGPTPWSDPRAFGALADDGVDDTAAIQASIDAVGADGGGMVFISRGTFDISATLVLASPITLKGVGAGLSVLRQTVSGAGKTIEITSSYVTISSLSLLGPTPTDSYVLDEVAIYASGPYEADYLRGLRLTGLEIMNFGYGGITLHRVAESIVSENRIRRIGYEAVACLSCDDVIVSRNSIRSVKPGAVDDMGIHNAYGIYFSHLEVHPTANNPSCNRCIADTNVIQDIPDWEALDCHDGSSITFSNNVIKNCRLGIHAGGVYGGSEAMTNITIVGNSLHAADARHLHYGIVVSGTPTHYALNVVVANNNVSGYGIVGDQESGAIHLQYTGPTSVTGNIVHDFAEAGIHFNVFNTNMLCSGNLMSTGTPPASAKAISVLDETTYGFIIGNRSNGFGLALPAPANVNVGHNDL